MAVSSSEGRAATLRRLKDAPRLPVLIVGGGVNGAGTFRDLALQGVDCLLVDKGDWCSGTSAAPSRLIHGGLKYLETGEFRLVAESTLERNRLLRNAPHLVKPLPTAVPVRSWLGGLWPSLQRLLGRSAKVRDRGLVMIEIGLGAYDWLGRRQRAMPRHGIELRAATHRRFPGLDPTILATATYYDARVTQAERLVFELVADGVAAHPGARALNYMALVGQEGGRVVLADATTGERVTVEPQVVVNAAGPWIDRVGSAVGLNTRVIGGTRGSHLVVDNPGLVEALGGRMIYFGSADGRICLVYPFFGRALIGATDIRDDDPDRVFCHEEEIDYLLARTRELFPGHPVTRAQILYRYAGIRPLPAAAVDDPGEISRDHSIRRDRLPGSDVPILALVGGKWTTFRAFAAQAADEILSLVGAVRRRDTAAEPIGGGRGYPSDEAARRAWVDGVARRFGVTAARAGTLLDRYGTRVEALLAGAGAEPDTPLASLPDYTVREIVAILEAEQVVRLADLVFRRTPLAVTGALTRAALAELAELAAPVLGWTAAVRDAEVEATAALARDRHGMRLG